jgi:hypothetical protein
LLRFRSPVGRALAPVKAHPKTRISLHHGGKK